MTAEKVEQRAADELRLFFLNKVTAAADDSLRYVGRNSSKRRRRQTVTTVVAV